MSQLGSQCHVSAAQPARVGQDLQGQRAAVTSAEKHTYIHFLKSLALHHSYSTCAASQQ